MSDVINYETGEVMSSTGLAPVDESNTASAAVDTYNSGKGGKKIPSWWRSES